MAKPKIGIAYGFYNGNWIGYSTTHLFEMLQQQFARQGMEVQKIGLLDTEVRIQNNQLEVANLKDANSLRSLDGLYFANWRKHPEFALATAEYLHRQHKAILSEEVLRVVPMTKLGEMVLLSDKGLPLPNSIFMRSKYWLRRLKADAQLPFGQACIVKSAGGTMGADNYLVKDTAEFKRILKENPQTIYAVQEFIPNTCDYRLIVMGGEVKIVIRRARQNDDTHLNNTSQGASAELVPLSAVPAEMMDLARRAAVAVGRSSFCGVDILQHADTGAYYILEVNKTPQMETGTNTAEKVAALVDYFAKRLTPEAAS